MVSPEILRRFTVFAGLEPAAYRDVAMLSREVSFKAGEWLFHEGDDATALYLLVNGAVGLEMNIGERGARQHISTLVEGELVGWSALVEPYIFTLGAQATKDSKLVAIDAASLLRLMESNTEIGYVIMTQLAKSVGDRLTNLRVQFASLIVR
ncbi:MAG: cyclic nucleotide-binding domain-containing protein [Anaerolineae bacterium]|nr:cyclic nucleotide-binding domain-containing protein [Anaerolineae bacterium]